MEKWNEVNQVSATLPEILPFTKNETPCFMDYEWQTIKYLFSLESDLKIS